MRRSFPYVETLKDLRQNIARAASRMCVTADTTGVAETLFQNYVQPIIQHYNPIVSSLAEHHGCSLLRARKCVGGSPFTNLADLLNPPIPSGRAFTSEDVPILYASTSIQTCLSETDPKIGDVINVVGLNYSDIRDRSFWFVGQLASFYKSGEPSHYVSDRNELFLPAYFPEDARHSFLFQDALLNEIFSVFSSPNDGYALNRLLIIAIREKLAPNTQLDGVVFLSIKDAPGVNFAVFGDAIQNLEARQLNVIQVVDIDNYGYVAYKLLQNGSLHDGKITWQDV